LAGVASKLRDLGRAQRQPGGARLARASAGGTQAQPATVNSALAAADDFYIRRGLGAAAAKRAEIPHAAPRTLDAKAQIRHLWALQARLSARAWALALGRVLYWRADR